MYRTGIDVSNVTAGGEQIVGVIEAGLCDSYTYEYDNLKRVMVSVKKSKIVNVLIWFNKQNEVVWSCNYNNLTEEEKEKYLPEAEYELVTQNAVRRYEINHVKYRSGICNIL